MTQPAELKELFAADDLADAVMTATKGNALVMPVPCQRVASGVVIFPWPTRQGSDQLVLHLGTWLISHPVAETLPIRCIDQREARQAALAFLRDVEANRVTADDQAKVADWCHWWCSRNPNAAPFDIWPAQ